MGRLKASGRGSLFNISNICQASVQEHHVALCADHDRGFSPVMSKSRGFMFEVSSAQTHALLESACYQAAEVPAHFGLALPSCCTTMRGFLDKLGFEHYTPRVAIRVPEPLAMLMARGAWKTLSLACSDTWKDKADRVKVPACASS